MPFRPVGIREEEIETVGIAAGAALQAAWPLAPQPRSVRFAYGTADSFENLATWPFSAPAQPSLTNISVYRASVTGLTPGVEYFGRFVATLLDGSTYVSGERITFHAATVPENMMRNLRITEIMYHPAPPTAEEALRGFIEDDFEWLELFNDSPTPMDLSGCWWSGISLDFPATGGPVLQPGQRGIIAAHPHAFAARYGAGIPLFAWTLHPFRTDKLSNSGEALNLYAADGTSLLSSSYSDFNYTDDGGGYSLDSEGTPAGQAATWITSRKSWR